MRRQWITLESGIEVVIEHDSKCKCKYCKKDIIWALVPLELVSLAKWDLHKCSEKENKELLLEEVFA